jgi:hypothetical protein
VDRIHFTQPILEARWDEDQKEATSQTTAARRSNQAQLLRLLRLHQDHSTTQPKKDRPMTTRQPQPDPTPDQRVAEQARVLLEADKHFDDTIFTPPGAIGLGVSGRRFDGGLGSNG